MGTILKQAALLILLVLALRTHVYAQTNTCDDVLLLVNFTVIAEDQGQLTLYWYDLSDKSAVPVVIIPAAMTDGFRDTTVVVNSWSPDRTQVLYSVSKGWLNDAADTSSETNLYVLDCLGSNPIRLAFGDEAFSVNNPIWLAETSSVAYLTHITTGNAQSKSFHIEVVNTNGGGRQVLYETQSYLDWLHWSLDGLIFIEGPTLYLLKNGEKTPLFVVGYLSVRTASPDGTKIALTHTSNVGEVVDILLFDLQTLRMSLLVADTRFGVTSLSWSPDSSQVAFMERGQDAFRIKMIRVDGSGLTSIGEPITDWTSFSVITEWTTDGKTLVLRTDTRSFHDYFLLHLDGELEQIVLPSQTE